MDVGRVRLVQAALALDLIGADAGGAAQVGEIEVRELGAGRQQTRIPVQVLRRVEGAIAYQHVLGDGRPGVGGAIRSEVLVLHQARLGVSGHLGGRPVRDEGVALPLVERGTDQDGRTGGSRQRPVSHPRTRAFRFHQVLADQKLARAEAGERAERIAAGTTTGARRPAVARIRARTTMESQKTAERQNEHGSGARPDHRRNPPR